MIDGVEEAAEWRWKGAGLFELQLAKGGPYRLSESYLGWSNVPLAGEGTCGRGVGRMSWDPAAFIRKQMGVPLARSSFAWRIVSVKSDVLIGRGETLRPQVGELKACRGPPWEAALRCPFFHQNSGVRVML